MSKTIAKRATKVATKKSSVKKSAASKRTVKKTVAKKKVAKKVVAKKAVVRKAVAKKVVARKTVAKKAPAKKAVAKKTVARKPRITARQAAIIEMQQIKGIGEKFAALLHKNGIKSVEALSKMLKADVLRVSAKMKIGNRMTAGKWVAQAKKLARKNAKRK